jgi:hypothetical protein
VDIRVTPAATPTRLPGENLLRVDISPEFNSQGYSVKSIILRSRINAIENVVCHSGVTVDQAFRDIRLEYPRVLLELKR